ncbi:BadF/BadG/BcrA/BcrD ATPase family protein [Micromonospora sp. NPDC050397]|uniref:BadF/BadG/BcrA/BcrD ATPase family protein n=1 Tax=Micromonospora sp. NPDC050397 TaxID=3364279 RepID=UPI00384E8951
MTAARFAIDAGGSRTRVRVEPVGGPPRIAEYPTVNRASVAADEADAVLARILTDVRDWIGADPGVGWLASATADEQSLRGESVRVGRVAAHHRVGLELVLSNDIVPMLWGPPALRGTGVAVVCGTGSGFLGADHRGRTRRVGGCEYLGSDEGSAFDLGWRGLRAAVRAADGRGPATGLVAALEARAGRQVTELARELAGEPFPKQRLARLAPVVCRAWLGGDTVATGLVEAAVAELALGVRTVAERLELPPGYAVAAVGGVLTGCPEFFAALRARLSTEGVDRVELISDTVTTVADALRHVVDTGGRLVPPTALRPHVRLVRP